jgi:hypothetical protein
MQSANLIPFPDLERMAATLFRAGMFKLKTPEQAVGLMLIAQAEGLHPMHAFLRFHIMEDGRPSMKSSAVQAAFQERGGKVEWLTEADDRLNQRARFTSRDGIVKEIGYSIIEAQAAGYVKALSNWVKDPASQLRARTITRGVRMLDPAVLGGLYSPEELIDIPADNSGPVPPSWTPAQATAGISPATAAAALAADHITLPAAPAAEAAKAPASAPSAVPAQALIGDLFGADTPAALAYLVSLGWIKPGGTFANLNQGHEARIRKGLEKFRDAARKSYQTQGAV